MKIATLSSKDTFGGAARVAYRISEQLTKDGIQNLFLVNNKRSDSDIPVRISDFHKSRPLLFTYARIFFQKQEEKKRLSLWRKYPGRKDTVKLDLQISLLQNALKEVEKSFDFDILQLHWVGDSFVNFTEFKHLNKSVVWTLHDCFAFTGVCTYFEDCDKYLTHCGKCPQLDSDEEKDLSYITFEQKKERYPTFDLHIVCPSNWLAGHARKSSLLKNVPVSVIPNGIDTDFFCPMNKVSAKKSFGIDPSKKIILFGGIAIHKDKRKGGHLLIEALNKLSESYGQEDIELLVLGVETDKNMFNYKTTYLGYVEDESLIRVAYCAADITILPSMSENLSTTIMESMSCETPVVAFNIGGNSDMIDHQQNGYLAQAYDTDDLEAGIGWCLENNEANSLGKEARQKVLNNFRIEDVTKQYIDLYKSLLK